MTFPSTLEKFDSNLWGCHVPIPEEIAPLFIEGNNRRIVFSLNGSSPVHAALMKAKPYWFILVNKTLRDQLGLTVGSALTVYLEKDNSEYGHEVPEELQVLLDQDDVANSYFQKLTKGKQRALIYIVSKVKSPQSRLNKALAIASHLVESKGKLDFKVLNIKIKHFNNL
jgi:hypothetical protein